MKNLIYISIIFLFSVHIYGQTHSTQHYNSFNDFCEKITNQKGLKFIDIPLIDTLTQTKRIDKNSIEKSFSLKLIDCELKFVVSKKLDNSSSDSSYILYNNVN